MQKGRLLTTIENFNNFQKAFEKLWNFNILRQFFPTPPSSIHIWHTYFTSHSIKFPNKLNGRKAIYTVIRLTEKFTTFAYFFSYTQHALRVFATEAQEIKP